MNRTHDGKNYGISQYARPKSFELAGKTLRFEDAAGNKFEFEFLDKHTLNFTADEKAELSQYEAVKLTADVFFVSFGIKFKAAVIDVSAGLAAVSGAAGEYIFLRKENSAAEFYDYTDNMIGTYVRWVFGCDRFLLNEYLEDGKCSCVWSPRTERKRIIKASYIHIKDGIYLVELNGTSPFYTDIPQGMSRMVLLQNYDQMTFVGCLNSPVTNESITVGGYGLAPETGNI
ncbi:MAG: MoaF N-terminal domain-containing protein [Oscillospiraceae bacterium]|nr:MoaF N-terminal domain-containing protein [Oscillospiraceae bacterium]